MSLAGRPLRFVVGVMAGWTVLRVAMLLPEAASIPAAIDALLPAAAASESPTVVGRRVTIVLPPRASAERPHRSVARATDAPDGGAAPPGGLPIALAGLLGLDWPRTAEAPRQVVSITVPGQRRAAAFSRWSASAWLAVRAGGAGRAIADGGQLGGSQAGVRLRYALDPARALSATARVSAPLEGIGREAALGLEWRPHGAPFAIIGERRFAFDGGAGGTALFAVGGFGPRALGAGLMAEGYAQAGGVLRDGIEPFADGAVRISRSIAQTPLGDLSLGAGAWGGAQRGAARLDIGPSLGLAMPLGNRAVRLSLDWRQRVAGRARPGSGVAFTLGSDF